LVSAVWINDQPLHKESSADTVNTLRSLTDDMMNPRGINHLLVLGFAVGISWGSLAQEVADWGGAQVTKTNLLIGETNQGKFAYFLAATMTRAGCHVAKVEGERGKGVFVRRDGQRGKAYEDIAHPVFSPDGSSLAYAVRGTSDSIFVVNEQEGPRFEEVMPDTFVFSDDGKRHAYLAKRGGRIVAVVDGQSQPEGDGDMQPFFQPPKFAQAPTFSADGSSVGYIESSQALKKMRAVINGKPGEIFDGIGPTSLRFSSDGRRFSYAANERKPGNRWFCVIDGQQRSAFDDLGVSYAISPDGKRIAYTGRRGGRWFLVVDGEPEIPVEGIVDHSLVFSPDGRRLAYAVAKSDRRVYLVVDGKAGPVRDGIAASIPTGIAPDQASMQTFYGLAHPSLLFSPDSTRIAYFAHFGLKKRVYVDDKDDGVEMEYLEGGMVFSEDSKRLAYGGRGFDNTFREKRFLVVDGKRGADYDGLGYFGFSQDGKHIAYAAKKGAKFVIVVDGVEHGEYSAVAAGPVFRSDGVLEFLAADKPSLYRFEVKNL
jgi:Tol biopolymer transport system component